MVKIEDVSFITIDSEIGIANEGFLEMGDGRLCGSGVTGWWYGRFSCRRPSNSHGARIGTYGPEGWDDKALEWNSWS